MDISFQLYSAREFTPWDGVLKQLSELGYTQVEGFAGNYEDPATFRAMLNTYGLTMPSGHFFPMEQFEEDIAKVIATAKTLGMSRVFVPAVPPAQRSASKEDWSAVAKRLEAIAAQMKAAGLRFGWHNHDFEFKAFDDGSFPMEIILRDAPSLEWEMDVAWVARGGEDPLAWIERYKDRITTAHVKDIAPEGECTDEDGWADVGQGIMDWKAIMGALRAIGVDLFVMEHDKPSNAGRFASRSIEAFRTY
ncbi:sugar phosphate isomerase/epimerase [Roseibium sp. CAU 1637]|uniref:Sugar phosphate isomerase/epimerase n=1 Tax=Roseibium limicola TaxID=2816037 RepID=A0A939EKB3_9HYPH|nr:sugar phosphate isomerase/epimerase [Roseibium limicola]MBO0344230.1 sugar phosphate isomerase/epimerase [Roseibium limicola]